MKIPIDDKFSGVISVKQENKYVFHQAFGSADKANDIPNQMDTRFACASAGKIFVSVGILQLIEQKKLRLDSTIGELIDMDWKGIDTQITVNQLLTHTSGIPDYFDETIMEAYDELWKEYPNYKIRTSADLIPFFIDKPMMYPRGERFQYNNTGYVVLGLIIEAIAKQPFDEYLKDQVFDPCGMTKTGYYELDRLPRNCANHYIFDEKKQVYYTNIYSVDVKGTGAGGVYSCVQDIEQFWQALYNHQLFSREMTNEMLRIQARDEIDAYGYGVWLSKLKHEETLPLFMGFDPGVSFVSCYYKKTDTTITIMSNAGNRIWKLFREIRQAYEIDEG